MFVRVYLSSYTPITLHMLKCTCALTLSCCFTYCYLLVLGMQILYDLLSHHVFGKVCIYCQSQFVLFLWRSTWCLTLGIVLPLFYSQFLLLSLLSIARGTCLLHWYAVYPYSLYTAHALLCFSISSLKPLPIFLSCVAFHPVLHHAFQLVDLILL
jgi:hypothetical protein